MTPSESRHQPLPNQRSQLELDQHWMRLALEQAQIAAQHDEVPIGAVLVEANRAIGAAYNCPIATHDTSAHAEILALRQASQSKSNYRLPGTTLYVTIEPCTMCVGALIHARVERLVFGAREPRAGAVASLHQLLDAEGYNHKVSYTEGILAEDCGALLQKFFKARRTAV